MNFLKLAFICTFGFSFSALAQQTETIMGYSVDREGIEYQVSSGGCTSKDDFTFRMLETHPMQLQLIRVNYDGCEAFLPFGTKIKFTWAELGLKNGTQFYMANPTAVIRVNSV